MKIEFENEVSEEENMNLTNLEDGEIESPHRTKKKTSNSGSRDSLALGQGSKYRHRSPESPPPRFRDQDSPPPNRSHTRSRSPRPRHCRSRSRSPFSKHDTRHIQRPASRSSYHPSTPTRAVSGDPIYFCDICKVDCTNLFNYREHLTGKRHATSLGPEALKQYQYRTQQVYRVSQNAHEPKIMKIPHTGENTACSNCLKFRAGDHFPCEVCKICCSCPISLEQHKTGKSHAEKVKNHTNEHPEKTAREKSQLSPRSASTCQVFEDKGNLEGFAWVKCKRPGCDFTEIGLEAAAMRHQDKAHNGGHGGGMMFFNIFCRICTNPDKVTRTPEVFDEAFEFYDHMRQCH